MTRQAETKKVKDYLAANGITAKVGHGTGTARSWIEIRLPNPIEDQKLSEYQDLRAKVERLVAKVAGRETWPHNCILVSP